MNMRDPAAPPSIAEGRLRAGLDEEAPPGGHARVSHWRRLALVVVAVVVMLVASRWHPDTGFTSLIRFGETLAAHQLPEVRRAAVTRVPGAGYDGQFYAQLAVELDLHRPELAEAIPGLGYRARRILLPWLAHVLGGGRPRLILQVYALLNVAAWLLFAWIWTRECPPDNAAGFARWTTGVLALGALDSVRMALTDLPATLLIVLGVRSLASGRTWRASALLAAGGLTRETAVLAAFAEWRGHLRHTSMLVWLRCAFVIAPAAAWSLWLLHLLPGESVNLAGNFDWPGLALARHLYHCGAALADGDWDSRFTFGLLGAVGLAAQSVYLLRRWRSGDVWVRMALPFAVLFWFLGDYLWHGYWAVARVALPMTLAFVRTAPLGWSFAVWNVPVLHAVYRLLP